MSISGYNPSDYLPSAQDEPTGSMAQQQAQQDASAGPKLTPVTDPAVLAKLNSNAKLTPVTDPATLEKLNKGTSEKKGSILGDVGRFGVAAGTGAMIGSVEGIHAMGTLADTVLRNTMGRIVPQSWDDVAGNMATSAGMALNDVTNTLRTTPGISEARAQFPATSQLTEDVASLGSQIATGNIVARPLQAIGGALKYAAPGLAKGAAAVGNAVDAGFAKVLPSIANSPAAMGAVKQGIIGGTINAAGNPDDPLSAFGQGAMIGGGIGAVSGELGRQTTHLSHVLNDTFEDMKATGENPYSIAGQAKLVDAAKSGGVELRKFEADKFAMDKAEEEFDAYRKNAGMPPDQHPMNWVANGMENNLIANRAQNLKNYDPINTSTVPAPATGYNNYMINNAHLWPKQISLPQNTILASAADREPMLNPNTGNYETYENTSNKTVIPTINQPVPVNQLLDYRKQLDAKVKQATGLIKLNQMTKADALPIMEARKALDMDIDNTLATIPYKNPQAPQVQNLKDQLQVAEDFNNEHVQPFKLVDKAGAYMQDPKTVPQVLAQQQVKDKILSIAGSVLNSQRPNFSKFNQVATMLGPEGKEKLTNAMIDRMFELSKTPAEEGSQINKLTTLNSYLTQFHGKGILSNLATPEQQQMTKGISTILTAASKTPTKAIEQGMLGKGLNLLTKSTQGITLLRKIGSTNTLPAMTKSLIKNTLTGLMNYTAPQPVQQDDQDLQDVQQQQNNNGEAQ